MRHTLTLIVAALVFASPVGAAVLKIVAIGASNTYGAVWVLTIDGVPAASIACACLPKS